MLLAQDETHPTGPKRKTLLHICCSTNTSCLIETFSVVLVFARVWISHVGEALGAEGRNSREPDFSAAGENGVPDGEVAWVVNSNDIARVGSLRAYVGRHQTKR